MSRRWEWGSQEESFHGHHDAAETQQATEPEQEGRPGDDGDGGKHDAQLEGRLGQLEGAVSPFRQIALVLQGLRLRQETVLVRAILLCDRLLELAGLLSGGEPADLSLAMSEVAHWMQWAARTLAACTGRPEVTGLFYQKRRRSGTSRLLLVRHLPCHERRFAPVRPHGIFTTHLELLHTFTLRLALSCL